RCVAAVAPPRPGPGAAPSALPVSAPSARREPVTAPDQLSIETPEQVALEFPLAGVGSRFLALAIDMLLQMAIGLLVFAAVVGAWSLLRPRAGGPWFLAVLVVAGFLLFYGYFAGFEAFWHGQTPGKRLIGLRVLSVTRPPARIGEAIPRELTSE